MTFVQNGFGHGGSAEEHRWFARLLESAPDALVIVDGDGVILNVNAETERLFGYPRLEVIGNSIEMLVPERFRGTHVDRRSGFLGASTPRPMGFGQQVVARHADGREIGVEVNLSSFSTDTGMVATASIRPVGASGVDERLREVRDLFGMAFDFSPLGMVLIDVSPDGSADTVAPRPFKLNKAFADMVGYSVEELLATEDQTRYTHPDDREMDETYLRHLVAGPGSLAQWEKRYVHADGYTVWAQLHVSLLRAHDGSPRYLICQVQDVTDRRHMEMQLVDLATRDELTGLLNRRAFEAVANEQLARCRRYGEDAAILLVDLNRLKHINDRYGHAAGDHAIRVLASVLQTRTRAVDTAGRFGGDEFVLLLPRTSMEQAGTVAAHINETLADLGFTVDSEEIHLSASIGCALMSQDSPDIETPLAEADRDMYVTKHQSRQSSA